MQKIRQLVAWKSLNVLIVSTLVSLTPIRAQEKNNCDDVLSLCHAAVLDLKNSNETLEKQVTDLKRQRDEAAELSPPTHWLQNILIGVAVGSLATLVLKRSRR